MWSALGDEPINRTAQWEPEPKTRGTWGILSTCLITLSLCVWSSLHLNLPEHNRGGSQIWRKIAFLTMGMLAPEFVALIAYRQWDEQRQLMKEMEKALINLSPPAKATGGWFTKFLVLLRLKEKPTPKEKDVKTERQHRWSHVHSFFTVMGGFVFDNSRAPEKIPLPRGCQRITLTTLGLVELAKLQPDLIPDVSEGQIRDKSKTNPLAKTLTCLQALWFCAQVLSRLGQHLAVSLLELNTFAHALCALVVYLLWWNKPLDIVEPFEIDVQSDRAAALCAMFCNRLGNGHWNPCWLTDANDRRKPYRQKGFFQAGGQVLLDLDMLLRGDEQNGMISNAGVQSEDQQLQQAGSAEDVSAATDRHSSADNAAIPSSPLSPLLQLKPEVVEPVDEPPKLITLYIGQQHEFFKFQNAQLSTYYCSLANTFARKFTHRNIFHNSLSIDIEPDFFVRAELMRSMPDPKGTHAKSGSDSLACFCSCNWIFTRLDTNTNKNLRFFMTTLAMASCLYSAWHRTAWEGPFRGHTEMVLWRGSSIGLGASAVTLLLLNIIIYEILFTIVFDGWAETVPGGFIYLLYLTFILVALFMVACRLGLVVESFIGIMYLPDSAYRLPSWSAYFPHIG